jgi:hypothetical protein
VVNGCSRHLKVGLDFDVLAVGDVNEAAAIIL